MTKREFKMLDKLMLTPKKNWEKLYHGAPWHGSVYRLAKNGYDVCISYRSPIAMKTPDGRFVRLWFGYSKTSMGHLNRWSANVGLPQFTGKIWDRLVVGKKYSPEDLAKIAKTTR